MYIFDMEDKISNYSKLSRYYYAQMQQEHVTLWFRLNQEVFGILWYQYLAVLVKKIKRLLMIQVIS